MNASPRPLAKVKSLPLKGDVPLVVDFDGTLQRSDLTWEALAWAARYDGWLLLMAVWTYLREGRAACKLLLEDHLLGHWFPDLPLDERVLDLLRQAEARGRRVVVATGSPQRLVTQVLESSGLEVEVWGTVENTTNLTARRKAEALVKTFGAKGFDYAGNSYADHPVWAVARKAWIINAGKGVTRRAMAVGNHEHVMPKTLRARWALLQGLRPARWLKNLLVFVPLLVAHQWFNMPLLAQAALAWLALSSASSAMYLFNDLLDITADRRDPLKRNRVLAAGFLPIGLATAMVPLLVALALLLAWSGGKLLLVATAVYLLGSALYTLGLKRWLVTDVVVLALLDVTRLVAGAVATGISLSFWLVGGAFLLFYSLASMLRYSSVQRHAPKEVVSPYAYAPSDAPLLLAQGVASGMLTVVVTALFVQSSDVIGLYRHPLWLGGFSLLLLWWLGRMWLQAHRGQVDDDPLVVALKDPSSWMTAVLMIAVLVAAV